MTYKIRGEAEIGVGFGLPRHTTASRTSYTPPQKGYKVYDTDMNQEFTWNGTTWATVLDIPDNTDFVDLTTPQQIAGAKTFTDDVFTVQRGALKVIETDTNDVFLRGYNSSSDRDTEVEIDGDQFQVTSTDNDDTKLAKILVSGGGLIQLQTQQAGALVQENRLNLTASGMDLTFYNTGFVDRTSLSVAAGEVIMSDVGSDSDFRFEPNSNNFSMSMNSVNVFSYEESTPRFQFNVPVRATATVDGDAATTLTTKQWVLDKITAGGAVQPDYELVTGTGSASYTLSFTPATATAGKATLQVFVNGLKQIEGATKAYTVSGSVVTFTTGNIPDSGDDVEFYGFG
jgi:hypothetical protein